VNGDRVRSINLGEIYSHLLAYSCRQVLAYKVGADRELSVATVDEYRQAHRPRTTDVVECIQSCTHCAT
jgi:hypothetical protein